MKLGDIVDYAGIKSVVFHVYDPRPNNRREVALRVPDPEDPQSYTVIHGVEIIATTQ